MRRVLCIDDDVDMLDFVHDVLPDEQVDCAMTAEAGLALLWEQDYAAIVVDLRMPGIGGGFYDALAAHLPHLLPRVVFITGNTESDIGRRVRRAGVALLPKPFTGDDMADAVDRAAGRVP